VQGVGFRPFVHRQAVALGLTGWVGNDEAGVLLEVEGSSYALDAFLTVLREGPPPLACIETIAVSAVPPAGHSGFAIAPTREAGAADVRVSADVAPCDACLAEMADPADRRYRYPFVNCTDCGPRYTIIHRVPYDRPSTTMAGFVMCPRCQAEYDDPTDRRFHAQPNACPDCGPVLRWSAGDAGVGDEALTAAINCLADGGIVAVKGVGGFHLACDASEPEVVATLRRRKVRDDKPFALMVRDLLAAEQLCSLTDAARSALTSPRRPVVLVPRQLGVRIAEEVAPGMPELGLMLPSSPLHVLLTEALDRPLVMTSGNRSDEPVVHEDTEVPSRLGDIADGVLTHDRPIHIRADDSVLRVTPAGRQQVLRRARGFVPRPLRLPVPAVRPVLAVGAELKNTVAVAREGTVVASHHLGDLEHWATYQAFLQAVGHLPSLAGVEPAVLAHDLHPEYLSTKWAQEGTWAQERDLPRVAVQHHHAHIAACLVEHERSQPVLGVAFDGLGYGTDGTLWGGEFLLADLVGAVRLGHLRTTSLPGGAVAIREPWRMAVSWLARAVGPEAAEELGGHLDPRCGAVLRVAGSGSAPETSSVGRLFDAIAALLGVRSTVSYEGQAAISLEALARRVPPERAPVYPFGTDAGVLDPAPMLRDVLQELRRRVDPSAIAAGFHAGLAAATAEIATRLAGESGVDTVVLTGGVFANVLLSDSVAARLAAAGLRVLQHADLPPGDGSISIGQAAVVAAQDAAAR
jgi:hydrogenase maturation protein HypF